MANRDHTALVGSLMLLAGGAIGAGLALLFAPQSGKKTRKDVRRYAKKVRSRAEEMAGDLSDSVTDLVDDLGKKTTALVERGGDVAEDWRKHLLDTLEDGQKSLEHQRRKLRQLWD